MERGSGEGRVSRAATSLRGKHGNHATRDPSSPPALNSQLPLDRLVAAPIDEAVAAQPRHEGAQLASDFLDRMNLGLFSQPFEVGESGAILGDPFVGEFARLDVGENLLHRLARTLVDDASAARHIAELGGVADRVAHVGDAAFVDQIDDQLDLVEAFEVRHLGRVTSLDQGLVAGANQFGESAAQHGLLAEEIGFGLLAKAGFDDRRTAAADGASVGEADLLGIAGRILLNREQARYAAAFDELGAHQVAGAFGRDHEDVHVGGRLHELEMDIEAMAEGEVLAPGHVRRDLVLVDIARHLVRHEDHDDVGFFGGLSGFKDAKTLLGGLVPGGAALAQADTDVHAAVAQVEGVGVTLAAEAENRDLLGPERAQIGVAIVKDFHGDYSPRIYSLAWR